MFRVPLSEKWIANFNKQLSEEFYPLVCMACLNHPSAFFIDGWQFENFTYKDFSDHEHLNFKGAKKFSAYLNDFIEKLER